MKNKSFTLIELLVVIVIIGVLAGVIMITTSSSIDRAKLSKGLVFSENIKKSLLTNIVSGWTFDDGNNIGNDDEGVNNLTFQNFSSESSDCLYNKCIYSIGADMTSYGFNESFPIPTSDLTMDIWFKMATDAPSSSTILSYAVTGSYNEIIIERSNDNCVVCFNGNCLYYSIKINDNKWHNLAVIRDRGVDNNADNFVYFDGEYVNNAPDTTGDLTAGGYLVIGQEQDSFGGTFQTSQIYKGYLDNITIYNTVLSSAFIRQNYDVGLDSLLNNGSMSKEDYNERIGELAVN